MRIFGKRYIFDYVSDRYMQELKELSYKVYMTDCMKSICGAQKRWYDVYKEIDNPRTEETFDAEEVKVNIMSKYNREVVVDE